MDYRSRRRIQPDLLGGNGSGLRGGPTPRLKAWKTTSLPGRPVL